MFFISDTSTSKEEFWIQSPLFSQLYLTFFTISRIFQIRDLIVEQIKSFIITDKLVWLQEGQWIFQSMHAHVRKTWKTMKVCETCLQNNLYYWQPTWKIFFVCFNFLFIPMFCLLQYWNGGGKWQTQCSY